MEYFKKKIILIQDAVDSLFEINSTVINNFSILIDNKLPGKKEDENFEKNIQLSNEVRTNAINLQEKISLNI